MGASKKSSRTFRKVLTNDYQRLKQKQLICNLLEDITFLKF